ncbi:hypothetical protein EDF81_3839 [Enterobacter sp. BIGb0383]|uniref:hypothetical protein n=1 Tax=unclassified Enterobacter TaxID=2608935 RepID=UPI000FBC6E4C|nr:MULTISPECIES: hypothetical protein [unclassified Enterobacter]ROP56287.1 hypothetical protein EDF81_3839 [Enterobacter sp. BIGb0383]ROS06026.1 hypothetical protein EC848_3979 [Enterobacter sp. BIGb0359]
MTERLKRIQCMAQRYNKSGVVKDETVASIEAAVYARQNQESGEGKRTIKYLRPL